MIKTISALTLSQLSSKAALESRLRTHLNIHESLDASVQRLFIATEPATYMRPHRHPESHKWEFFVVLAGQIDLLIFDETGNVIQREKMSVDDTRAVEVPPNTWHSYVCQQTGTLALEIKEGAYTPTTEENFAPWSPAENSVDAADYREWMRHAYPA